MPTPRRSGGLINDVVPAAELTAATRKLAAKVAEASCWWWPYVAVGGSSSQGGVTVSVRK
jgi:enoyl-CoA hydratase/carnithine racemase